jgi:hypothetical protein
VVAGSIALFFIWMAANSSNDLGTGLSLFFYAYIIWIIVSICTVAMFVLRLFKVIRNPNSFAYILLGTLNLAMGSLGLYQIYAGWWANPFPYNLILVLNILSSGIICYDVFIRKTSNLEPTDPPPGA